MSDTNLKTENKTSFCQFCKKELIDEKEQLLRGHISCNNAIIIYNNIIFKNNYINNYLIAKERDMSLLKKIHDSLNYFIGFSRTYSKNKHLLTIRDPVIPRRIIISKLKENWEETCKNYPQINSFYSCKSHLTKNNLKEDVKKSLLQTKSFRSKKFDNIDKFSLYQEIWLKYENDSEILNREISFAKLLTKRIYHVNTDHRTAEYKSFPYKDGYYIILRNWTDNVNNCKRNGYTFSYSFNWATTICISENKMRITTIRLS